MGFESADYAEKLAIPSGWRSLPLGQCIELIIDYRGKTPPKAPFGIPCLTAANVKGGRIDLDSLFPDKLVPSALGEIPKGWEVGCVNDGFTVTMGQSPPGSTYNEIGEASLSTRGVLTSHPDSRTVACTAPCLPG
ncbi:MAG: hypothetical protein ACC742_15370 [Thermoanaerobaculales bacterium]